MDHAKTVTNPWYQRYSWTVFVLIGAFVVLIGAGDLSSSYGDHTFQENALNELLVGILAIVIAVGGMRRAEPWAWYAMSAWTLWIVVQGLLAFSSERTDEGISAVVMLVLALAGLGLSFRSSFQDRR